jgi:hypothetical protein
MAIALSRLRRSPSRLLGYLLKSHYLSDEFPSVLTTTNLSAFCVAHYADLLPTDELLRCVTRYGTFPAPRSTTTRRMLALPHPASQLALSRIISENQTAIRDTIGRCSLTLYNTDAGQLRDRMFVGVDFKARTRREAEILSRYPIILQADIANFFHTIYSHSLPWAVLGKQHVKDLLELRRNDPLRIAFEEGWSNKLDTAVQRGNSRETFGIPVGPDTSRMIAEILLSGIYADSSLAEILRGREGYRLADDFFIGFNDEASARQCLDALRRVLWEYNLHLNEGKTRIQRSSQVFDGGWKHDIESFDIPSSSAAKQRDAVQRLMELALHYCATRNDPVPASFFCQRLISLEIMVPNFPFVRDCLLRIARDFTTCLKSVVRFATQYRHLLTNTESLAIMRRWCGQIFVAHGPRGHDMEVTSALAICGVLGMRVNQAFVGLRENSASPVVLAVLGLLGEDGLLDQPWDQWKPEPVGDARAIVDGPYWLPFYEAARRRWTTDFAIIEAMASDPFFGPLLQESVSFLDASDFMSAEDSTRRAPWDRRRRVAQRAPIRSGRPNVLNEYE